MGRKTGRKAKFIDYGNEEVKTTINGVNLGVAVDQTTQSHYVMLPQDRGRTKRKWLGKDTGKAVAKFWALIAQLEGEQDNIVTVNKEQTKEKTELGLTEPRVMRVGLIDKKTGKVEVKKRNVHDFKLDELLDIPEAYFIEWLKKELKDPSQLAKKTGIEAFNTFHEWMLVDSIKLSDLIDNFFTMRKTPISTKEKQKTMRAWEIFCRVTNKRTVEEISLNDIQKYEDYIHAKGYAPKTIHHYLNRVEKVFSYNTEKYQNNDRLIIISKWCQGMERLENTNTEEPEVITLEIFEKLYNNTHILLQDGNKNSLNVDLMLKSMLTYALNTASTLIDLSRLTKDELDLQMRTLSTRREKTGKIKKVAYLWGRTVKDLQSYLDSRKDESNYVFLSRTGTAYTDSGLRKLFKRYRRELCLPDTVEFKHLRDTFSTTAKDIDIDPFKINCVMGHSNKGQVDKYSKRQISNKLMDACLAVEKDYFGTNS